MHIAQPFRVQDIACATHISEAHLRRIFNEHTGGMTVARFVRNLRNKRAFDLLMHSDLNVGEIADRCGFRDPYVFSRAFKRVTGLSPAHYRKQSGR